MFPVWKSMLQLVSDTNIDENEITMELLFKTLFLTSIFFFCIYSWFWIHIFFLCLLGMWLPEFSVHVLLSYLEVDSRTPMEMIKGTLLLVIIYQPRSTHNVFQNFSRRSVHVLYLPLYNITLASVCPFDCLFYFEWLVWMVTYCSPFVCLLYFKWFVWMVTYRVLIYEYGASDCEFI